MSENYFRTTVSIPLELKKLMDHYPTLNWSRIAADAFRQAILLEEQLKAIADKYNEKSNCCN
jgi:hypothetical protein